MCRFAAYLGHPILVSQLVTEPVHSLIHQSYHSQERNEPLNGDGFGVAWFSEFSPRPALFKEITPAWNNDNLKEMARVTRSRCILAHIRAATTGSPITRLNCHPFSVGQLAFMHNGYLAHFARYKRVLRRGLSDEAYNTVLGSTDSEHAMAVFYDIYRATQGEELERLAQAVLSTIAELERIKREAGVDAPSHLNLAVADGERMVATRYGSLGNESASLYYMTGAQLRCADGRWQLNPDDSHDVVMVASEKLSPDLTWYRVPDNHMVLATHPGKVQIRPILGEGLPAPPATARVESTDLEKLRAVRSFPRKK